MAVLLTVLVVPGLLVSLAARLPLRHALAASVPVTYGVTAIAGFLFDLIGLRWDAGGLVLATLVTVVVVLLLGFGARLVALARRSRSAVQEQRAGPSRGAGDPIAALWSFLRWPVAWWLPALAVAAASWATGQMILTELSGTNGGVADIFQGWDAHWHVDYIRFIHDTGIASPDRAGDLRYPENSATLYYPSTWHSVAAVVMQLTGVGSVEIYNLVQIGTLSLGFPLGVAALTRLVTRSRLGEATSITATACAALATPLFPGLPFVEIMVAATPSAAANSLAGLVAALVVAALSRRRLAVPAALALVGIGGVHPSAMVTAGAMVLFWWLFDGLWRPVRGRLRDLAVLAGIALAGAGTLLPQLLTISQEADDISSFEFQIDVSRAETWGKAATLQVRHVQDWGVRWVLLAMALCGLLVLLRRRVVWPVLLWAGLLVVTVNAMSVFGNWTGGALRSIGSIYYNDPRRLGVSLAILVAMAVGVGVAALAQGAASALGRLVDPLTDPEGRGVVYPRIAVAAAALVAVGSWTVQAAPEYAVAAGTSQRWDRMVDVHDRRAFDWLARQPRAYEGLIYTNPDEGSGWMYATNGLPSTSRHYLQPGSTAPLSTYLFFRMDRAGVDPRVDRALRELDITYVYVSPPNYWGFQKPNRHLLDLNDTPGLVKVYADSQVRIFAVRAAFTPEQLERIRLDSPFPPERRTPVTRATARYGPE